MVPISGSAYTYSYATLGELVAWIIGWDLIIEYAVGNIAVAISWSGYFQELLRGFGIHWPVWLGIDYRTAAQASAQRRRGDRRRQGPARPRSAPPPCARRRRSTDAPHCRLVRPGLQPAGLPHRHAASRSILVRGIRESASFNSWMVGLKLAIIAFFLGIGAFYVKPENWTPFAPNGFEGIAGGGGDHLLRLHRLRRRLDRRRGEHQPAARHADRDPRQPRRSAR